MEEYIDDFQRLQSKVDPAGNILAATLLKKFVKGLNQKIAPLIYATNPANLTMAIDTATRISTGFKISLGSGKVNQVEERDKINELKEQMANLVLVEQIKAEKQKEQANWNGRTNWNSNANIRSEER